MLKRIFGGILCAVVLLSLCFAALPSVGATSDYETSQAAIDVLKSWEGFSAKPYWDVKHYTIGYGTTCPDDKVSYYNENPMTTDEAEQWLKNYLDGTEKTVNDWIDNKNLQFNQSKFDAVVLLSYNCGAGWISAASSNLYKAVVDGIGGNDFIRCIALWCNAGGQISTGLLSRRLCEAYIYLEGQYRTTPPDDYGYVYLDANGGSVSSRIQGFNASDPTTVFYTPTHSQYIFDGWYTEAQGGTKVTLLDSALKNKVIYAHWVDAGGTVQSTQGDTTVVSGTVTLGSGNLNVRTGPGTIYPKCDKVANGTRLTFTERRTVDGTAWGKYDGGWVCLDYVTLDSQAEQQSSESTAATTPTQPAETQPKETTPAETQPQTSATVLTGVTTASGGLNVRNGAGTSYKRVGSLKKGTAVTITETKVVGSATWGKISNGWICMSYVRLTTGTDNSGSSAENSSSASTTTTGVVKVGKSGLNVRASATVHSKKVGSLKNGTSVTIYETKSVGSAVWGRISSGWICMSYVNVTGSASASSTEITGTVSGCKVSLNIRSGAGSGYKIVGTLANGTQVTVTSTKKVGKLTWGKISSGWICMSYIK